MQVEIWSDVVCPWCYLGKRRFQIALDGFPHKDDVEVIWRSFQLDPSVPPGRIEPVNDWLIKKLGVGPARLRAMHDHLEALADVAHAHGLPVHMDGARLFNAAVALGRPAADFARAVDSVTFCVSKGLGAPVGSVVCGPRDVVGRARRGRKMVGGGMRQAGVLAAAGVVALERMVDRLAEDHANARALWQGLAANELFDVSAQPPDTNIVVVGLRPGAPPDLARRVQEAGVLFTDMGAGRMRFVTHYGIEAADISEALARIEEAFPASL